MTGCVINKQFPTIRKEWRVMNLSFSMRCENLAMSFKLPIHKWQRIKVHYELLKEGHCAMLIQITSKIIIKSMEKRPRITN